jgi:alpha-mannosidase
MESFEVGGEPIPSQQALGANYRPFQAGEAWGRAWDTVWFRVSGKIPESWKGREVVALLNLGGGEPEGFTCEGQVWQNGVPTRGLNVNRADVPIVSKARGGEAIQFHVEAGAKPGPATGRGEVLPLNFEPTSKPLFRLEQAELACFNRDAWDLYFDFKVALETLLVLPANEPRRGQLLAALNQAANLFSETDREALLRMRKALREAITRRNGDTVHQLSAVGHAHIDTAWLWPLRETIRKCARTFSTVLAYIEEYPDFVFACSQPQQYAWMREYYPEIYKGIKRAVKRGQWEPVGAMWVESDCNLPSGESLVRQILHGKRFFQEEFGLDVRNAWLPDTFGFNAALPQVLKLAGVEALLSQKISWNQFNTFPHSTFLWEGIDGSRIFTHFASADTYNGDFSPKQLLQAVHDFKDHDRATRSLYPFGHGDGGGGPTKGMLEIAKRVRDFEGLPRTRFEKVSEFLEKTTRDAKDLPVWVGELYLELHRGTYTTQSRTKRANRKSEFLLRDAEFFDAILSQPAERRVAPPHPERAVYDVFGKGEETNAAYLNRAWKLLLLNQFHDILPGCSINWVYRDSARDFATIKALGDSIVTSARQKLIADIDTQAFKQPVVVFNTSSHQREAVVTLPDGSPVFVSVPSCGYAVVEGHQERPVASFATPIDVSQSRGKITLENGILLVTIDEKGFLSSVYDQRLQREALQPGARGNLFQLHDDYPNQWDAWDVDAFYKETCQDITDLQSIEVVEKNELRATVRIVRKFGNSTITQRVTLRAGSPRIDFHTEVNWHETHKFLKVAFPVNVRASRATYEIPFGHVDRPTHSNTSHDLACFEVPAQKWADLSEGDYGVALLNDCKYGYDISGNVMRLSLLRASTAPDPIADHGKHEFTYSLLPHQGDFRMGQVVNQGYALNNPLQVVPTDAHPGKLPKSRSFFQVDRPGVIIETVKRAERDNAIVLRIYEAHGTRGPATLATALPIKEAQVTDLFEKSTHERLEIVKGQVFLNLQPFQILTLKLLLA